ncbi:MAG: Multi antimicrobial extrusion protein ((+)/drug antiporter), family of efflux p [Devosia sp.]|uniref:MATE family efflux transporter n=1 Tax=Devosia sp. TaxID=1871048 RepID=UPI0026023135|nr:MATE family efflux transporter [Devosia sp.]MDB5539456.1 Multi antimicrobial extrusion protein ((+)/drug antiporter), family of efflux p [Devosia sp.]
MNNPSKPLWQRFLVFLVPLMASNILQALSGTINNIYIGQLIGVEALAAVSVFFPIMIFLISFVIGLASGATILIGQAWGAKNILKIKEVVGTTLTVGFLMGLVVAIFGALFAQNLMELLGAPADIVAQATAYGRVVLLGMPGFFVFLLITSMLRGVGDTVTPLLTLIFSIGVGLFVTPALILGWLGLPQIGVLAAAVAFITGFVVVLIFLFFYLNAKKSPLAPDAELFRHLKVDFKLLGLILKLGIPAGVAMVVSSISAIVIVGIVNRFGSDATAAYGAVNQVLSYVQFPAMSIGIAASIFAAQAIGARRFDEVERVTRTALLMNLVVTGTLVLVAYLFSEHLVRLFINDEAVVQIAERLLHIVLWSCLVFGWGSVFSAVMRASGDVWIPMALSLAAIILVEVPAALTLSHFFGLDGVWWGYCLSFTALLTFQATYYIGWWRKKEITALV